jgi:uncharacterized membrane protein
MSKPTVIFAVVIIFVYFIFTSGLWFWISDCKDTTKIITPFSYSLSGEKTGLVGITTQGDLDCIDWILNKSDQSLKVMVDSNAVYLLTGHLEKFLATWVIYGKEDRLLTLNAIPKMRKGYIFLTSWNTKYGKYIEPSDVGLRRAYPIVVVDGYLFYTGFDSNTGATSLESCKVKEVYRSGNAVVYSLLRD